MTANSATTAVSTTASIIADGSITIDGSVRRARPETRLGCIVYSVAAQENNPDLWDFYETGPALSLRDKLAGTELADMPQIGEARAAYKAFGIDPGRHRVSSEALYRRIRQGKPLYRINSLVDANNLISLETGFSLGSYDTSRVGPDVVFRLGLPGESYPGIGKTAVALENMPLLADAGGPFGSPTSDSTRGMITGDTARGLTVIYCFSAGRALEAALELAVERLSRFAGVTGHRAFII